MKLPTTDIHATALIKDVEKLVCRQAGHREVEVAARVRRASLSRELRSRRSFTSRLRAMPSGKCGPPVGGTCAHRSNVSMNGACVTKLRGLDEDPEHPGSQIRTFAP
jgi:hypothetical protein